MSTQAPLLWDNHTYLPQLPGTSAIDQLDRHRQAWFNVEGLFSLGEQIAGVSLFYDLGGTLGALVYNRRKQLGSGVHDETDLGLTKLGWRSAKDRGQRTRAGLMNHYPGRLITPSRRV